MHHILVQMLTLSEIDSISVGFKISMELVKSSNTNNTRSILLGTLDELEQFSTDHQYAFHLGYDIK